MGNGGPGLRRIKISSSSESPDISIRKRYRAKVDGAWYEGTFSKQWFGWQFDGYGTGIQLNLIDELYERTPSPPARKKPPKA